MTSGREADVPSTLNSCDRILSFYIYFTLELPQQDIRRILYLYRPRPDGLVDRFEQALCLCMTMREYYGQPVTTPWSCMTCMKKARSPILMPVCILAPLHIYCSNSRDSSTVIVAKEWMVRGELRPAERILILASARSAARARNRKFMHRTAYRFPETEWSLGRQDVKANPLPLRTSEKHHCAA